MGLSNKTTKNWLTSLVGIVVEFRRGQHPRAEHDQTDLTILTTDGDDTGDGVVRGISFHNNGMIWQPMSQNGGRSEGVLKALESNMTVVRERPRDSFPGKVGKRNHNLGVLVDEATIKVRKTEEGLDRKSTRLNSSHLARSRMPSSA